MPEIMIMKISCRQLLALMLILISAFPAEAARRGGPKTTADVVYESRVGKDSPDARSSEMLLRDLTRYNPYMERQNIPGVERVMGSGRDRYRSREEYQMQKLYSINSGELTQEQYRSARQDFIRARESTYKPKKVDINKDKTGSTSSDDPVTPKPADGTTPQTLTKEKKRSEFKNPIDEYFDKLAEKEDKAKAESLKKAQPVKAEPVKAAVTPGAKKVDATIVKPEEKKNQNSPAVKTPVQPESSSVAK
jgi:hypothetical protein